MEIKSMTVKEFADKLGVSQDTVREWFHKNYIPGAVENNGVIFIPDSARRPYTHKGKREKKQEAIIKACNENCSITASWFNLDEAIFQSLLGGMVQSKLIQLYIAEDGVTYYNITADGVDRLKQWSNTVAKEVWKIIQAFLPAAALEGLKLLLKIS